GKERRSMALSQKEKTNTAYPEARHALLLELLPHTEPLHKVTIIPRGPSLGSTMWLREEDKYTNRKNELLASLAVKMGGCVAEQIVFGDVTTGAAGDIKLATAMARNKGCEWGMSEQLGLAENGEHEADPRRHVDERTDEARRVDKTAAKRDADAGRKDAARKAAAPGRGRSRDPATSRRTRRRTGLSRTARRKAFSSNSR